jgi:hypothetical protein
MCAVSVFKDSMRLFLFITMYLTGSFLALNATNIDQVSDSIIITFDMRGGQKPRSADGPVLQLHSSGKLIVRALKPGDPPLTVFISQQDQVDLISKLIDDMNALALSTANIEQDIHSQNIQIRSFPDAPITFLSLDLPNGSTLVAIKGVSALAYIVPNATSLQKLLSIQRFLLDYANQINAQHPN